MSSPSSPHWDSLDEPPFFFGQQSSDLVETRAVKRRRENLEAAGPENWDQEPVQTLSVSAPVRKKYGDLLRDLHSWVRKQRLSVRLGPALDRNLARYLNKMFADGADLGECQKMMAALKFSRPEYGRWGETRLLSGFFTPVI